MQIDSLFVPENFDDMFGESVERFRNHDPTKHALLYGSPGSGKTIAANIYMRGKVDPENWNWDALKLNASNSRGLDVVRITITNFLRAKSKSGIKFLLLDEGDYMTADAFAGLRVPMEQYRGQTCIIITANFIQKIPPAIRSRTEQYDFSLTKEQCCTFLKSHVDEFSTDRFEILYTRFGPDLRKLQTEWTTKELPPDISGELFKAIFSGKTGQARDLLAGTSYSSFYRNLVEKDLNVDLMEQLVTVFGQVELMERLGCDVRITADSFLYGCRKVLRDWKKDEKGD